MGRPSLSPRSFQRCFTSFTTSMRLSVVRVGSAGWGDNVGEIWCTCPTIQQRTAMALLSVQEESGSCPLIQIQANTMHRWGCVHWLIIKEWKTIMCNRKSMNVFNWMWNELHKMFSGECWNHCLPYMVFTYIIFNIMYTEVQGAVLPPTYWQYWESTEIL